MTRNLKHRNFGLGNRNMVLAAKNALKEGQYSFKTIDTNTGHFRQFILYIKNEFQNIKDLKSIHRQHVLAFANYLKEQTNQGELMNSTAQNRLSAVNTIISIARQDTQCHVKPVNDAGLNKRSFVITESKCVSQQIHDTAKSLVNERVGIMLDLQRAFGLRFKESALFNAQQALVQSQHGFIRVENGTKGGRPRQVPVTNEYQKQLLQCAAIVQANHISLTPKELSLKTFTQQALSSIKKTGLNFHAERHAYANARYLELMGEKSPVEARVGHGKAHMEYLSNSLSMSLREAAERDKSVRIMISHELGHSRIAITNNYLG